MGNEYIPYLIVGRDDRITPHILMRGSVELGAGLASGRELVLHGPGLETAGKRGE